MSVEPNSRDLPWLCRMPFLTAMNRACVAASGVAILALLLYNAYATGARYLFNAPPPGSTEISTFALPVIIFLGLAHNFETDKHIGVGVLASRLTPRRQTVLALFAAILIAFTAAVLVWKGTALCWEKMDEVSDTDLGLPMLPFYLFIPFGGLLLVLESIRKICLHAYVLRGARRAARVARDRARRVEQTSLWSGSRSWNGG